MKKFKLSLRESIIINITLGLVLMSSTSSSMSPEIVNQELQMEIPSGIHSFKEEVLQGEIEGTSIDHLAYVGPTKHIISLSDSSVTMFLFFTGNGRLHADSLSFDLSPESIAIPMNNVHQVKVQVPEGEELHFLQFNKKLSAQDLKDLKAYPDENKYEVFFTRFVDCEPYTEKIKSPNTVSRTVLPADIVPRVSLGTVEAPGPDEVGAHKHAMLDQLFLGLSDNDVVVHADSLSTAFKQYSLLHIPIGSSHWVTVEENKRMNYMWMDFFLTKEGQEWLKTHKPVSTGKSDDMPKK